MLNISLKCVKCQLIISSKENSLFFELISILSEVKHYNGEDIQNLCTSLGFIQHKNICKFRGNVHAESRILSEFQTIFIKITHIILIINLAAPQPLPASQSHRLRQQKRHRCYIIEFVTLMPLMLPQLLPQGGSAEAVPSWKI